MRDAGIQMVDDSELLEGSANPNRRGGGEVEEWASGIDAALASLGVDGGAGAGAERHPEKRMKAVSVLLLLLETMVCGEEGEFFLGGIWGGARVTKYFDGPRLRSRPDDNSLFFS